MMLQLTFWRANNSINNIFSTPFANCSISKSKTNLLMKKASTSSSSSTQFPGSSPDFASSSAGSKVPAAIEFPSSPQPAAAAGEEEITHYSHPKHPLAHVTLPELFVCGGCKEYGAGKRFTCQQCDFQLHEFCALSPPFLRGHPLHGQHQLVFHSRPKQGGISWPKCDICGKSSKGFTFRCRACSFQMHPCCAMLSICAKAMINGLQANGITPPEKPSNSMLGTAARLASQVVIEFIGGLIEGFGEGVGEVLVQTITRDRRRSRASGTVASTSHT